MSHEEKLLKVFAFIHHRLHSRMKERQVGEIERQSKRKGRERESEKGERGISENRV
jgi:hypothetical protein